jgi:hypothetical protein
MAYILVEFGADRNVCGALSLVDDQGSVICGGFAASGRSTRKLSERHGNPLRDPTKIYGDTPTGVYRVVRLIASVPDPDGAHERFGPHGVVVLEAVSGDAALADANGRFQLWIHGGATTADGALRSTAGAIRLKNEAMAELVSHLEGLASLSLHCAETLASEGQAAVFEDEGCLDNDPPPFEQAHPTGDAGAVARRRVLQVGAAATVLFRGAVAFVATEALAPAATFAATAYSAGVAPHTPEMPDAAAPVGQPPGVAEPKSGAAQDSGGPIGQIPPSRVGGDTGPSGTPPQ